MLREELAAMWQDASKDDAFAFDVKAQKVGVDLTNAFLQSGMTQQELAEKLGWRPSRVSKVLHGAPNLTLKTLFQVCRAMQVDFDVTFGGNSLLAQQLKVVTLKHDQVNTLLRQAWRSQRAPQGVGRAAVHKRRYELATG